MLTSSTLFNNRNYNNRTVLETLFIEPYCRAFYSFLLKIQPPPHCYDVIFSRLVEKFSFVPESLPTEVNLKATVAVTHGSWPIKWRLRWVAGEMGHVSLHLGHCWKIADNNKMWVFENELESATIFKWSRIDLKWINQDYWN